MGSRVQPALLGGLFIGVLSTLPIISMANACCCLWVISGGALAAWLLQQNQAEPITGADGALIGLMAGIVGAFVGAVLMIPVEIWFGPIQRQWIERLMQGQADVPPQFMEMLNRPMSAATVLADLIFRLVAYVVFGMLGGVLGVAIFRKKTAPVE
ncbi:MAG: hypothetical protein WD690_05135 [Vicinamibacterales bacterium]